LDGTQRFVQGDDAVIDKNWQEVAPDPDWVRQEVARLNEAVDEFASAMKAKLAQKAREGWTGWDKPESGIKIWNAMLAQGAAVPLAKGQEVDIANLAMMLWRTNGRME
jgi:hypothetical protein